MLEQCDLKIHLTVPLRQFPALNIIDLMYGIEMKAPKGGMFNF